MPTFNSSIGRSDSAALIPEDVAAEILQGIVTKSTIMRLAKKLPNLPRAAQRMPVLNVLPQAYFVNGDTGLKQTTRVAWDNVFLNVEEIAVIVPVPEAVINDVDYDMWGQVKPLLEESFGTLFDQTVLYGGESGYTKPSTWPDGVVKLAHDRSNEVVMGSGVDLYDDLLSEGGVFGLVEEDGYSVTGSVAPMIMKSKLRGTRTTDGLPIFSKGSSGWEVDGSPIEFPVNGAIDATQSLLVAGDWNQLVFAMRQDISWKVLTEGVITDDSNPPRIIFNLPQQDMVAIRAVMRLAWQIPNPINRLNPNRASAFPFANLAPPA
jgi:hypothetical protein